MSWLSNLLPVGSRDAQWQWTPLRPDQLTRVFIRDDDAHGGFAFEVKRVLPDIKIDFPTERRSALMANNSVEIHGAAYFVEPEKRNVSVLIVNVYAGDPSHNPCGFLRLRSKNSHHGLEASCRVYLSVPDARVFGVSLMGMLDACDRSSSSFLRTRRRVHFLCSMTRVKASAGDFSEEAEFEWPLRDLHVSIEDHSSDPWGAWKFVDSRDFGLLDDSAQVNLLCRSTVGRGRL